MGQLPKAASHSPFTQQYRLYGYYFRSIKKADSPGIRRDKALSASLTSLRKKKKLYSPEKPIFRLREYSFLRYTSSD